MNRRVNIHHYLGGIGKAAKIRRFERLPDPAAVTITSSPADVPPTAFVEGTYLSA